MERTEYERLVEEKQSLQKFLEAVNEEAERARAAIMVAGEWESRARKKLADIDKRLAEIRGV